MKTALLILVSSLCLLAFEDFGVLSHNRILVLDHGTTRPDFKAYLVDLMPSGTTNVVTLTITNSHLTVEDLAQMPSGRIIIGVRSQFHDGSESEVAIHAFDLRRGKPPAPLMRAVAVLTTNDPPRTLLEAMDAERHLIPRADMPPLPPGVLGVPSTSSIEYYDGPLTGYATNVVLANGYSSYTIDVQQVLEMLQEHTGSNVVFVPKPLPSSKGVGVTWESDYADFQKAVRATQTHPKPLPDATNETYAEHLDWMADRKGKRRNE